MQRVLVIGARRVRQGLGPFVARAFDRAGAQVCAIVGTSDRTAGLAADQLKSIGITCRAHTDLTRALVAEQPDIVAVCSPYSAHLDQLEAIAQAGAHCLCEKPMWWGPRADRATVTGHLVGAFARRNRYLDLVTQWPCTLGSYERLFPGSMGRRVETFEMGLGPVNTGPDMVLDAGPHVLSMLAALVGTGRVEAVHAVYSGSGQRKLALTFSYEHSAGRTAVVCRLETCPQQPRPAWYAINGRVAKRRIEMPEYRQHLETLDAAKSVALPDPLVMLVQRFLDRVRHGAKPDQQRLVESVTNLERLAEPPATDRPIRDDGSSVAVQTPPTNPRGADEP